MKINTLKLKAYGHFTGTELQLEQNGGLQLIYGPNEAGKSTALRALTTLFYGFDHQTRDGFLHQNKDLAVGACLELDSGQQWEITRYKRRKNDLLDASNSPVPQEAVNRLMSGMSRDMFSAMFGISHDNLRAGGKEILRAQGHLGQALFSAAAGIMHLRRVREDLHKRADELFRPRASSTRIMQKKSSMAELGRELRQASIKPERWKNLQNELKQKLHQKQNTLSRLKQLEADLAWHSTCIRALPRIARRRDLLRQLGELEHVPRLEQDFSQRRVKAASSLENARQDRRDRQKELQDLEQELSELEIDSGLIRFAPRIRTLSGQVALIQQAMQELQDLEAEKITLEQTIQDKKAMLGSSVSCSDMDHLAPDRKHQSRIQELASEKSSLDQKASQARESMLEQARILRLCRRDLKKMPPLPDIELLDAVSKKLTSGEDLQDKIRKAGEKVQSLQLQIQAGISSLGLASLDSRSLPGLPLPLPESLERMQSLLDAKEKQLESARHKHQELNQELADRQAELERRQKEHALPLPRDLESRRKVRDQGWSLIKKSWLQGTQSPEEIHEYLHQTGGEDLASSFEQSISELDQTTDQMLDRAHHLARLKALHDEIQACSQKIDQASKDLDKAGADYQQACREWQALWSETGIEPLSPREMQAWLYRAQELIRQVQEKQQYQQALEEYEQELQSLCTQGAKALESAGYSAAQGHDPATLNRIIDKYRDRARDDLAAADLLRKEIRSAEKKLQKAGEQAGAVQEDLNTWRQNWIRALESLSLDPDSDIRTVQEEIQLRQDLFAACGRMRSLQQRKAGLEQKVREFESAVQGLVQELKRNPGRASPLEILEALALELDQEEKKQSRQEHLQQERRKIRTKLDQAEGRIQTLQRELEQLCREAGAEHPEELPALEEKAAMKQELRTELRQQEEQLQELAGGEDLEKFINDASARDMQELQALSTELAEEKEELEKKREEIISEHATLEKELQDLDGTSKAADISQQIQEQKSELEQEVQEYIQLRLAEAILSSEMERFRQANQGPVLEMAGKTLNRITLGSLTGIYADYDQRGEPVLKALRMDGTGLGVEEMSDGTRDQLFLALRLGGIRHYLDNNPPFPFIVDDILVHFDDERSAQTLQELALLSKQTQVLFFTHHTHLLHLARQHLDPARLQIHEL
ncbi:SMC domain protein [Desulfonatronospira thiodismutans ASO3-1]|uniref:SMC domain protein n=1 Tax=Desulfonatronospira thiodismutans ASO3-1 TaxID=555779 RepID=D6SQ52_9BACT|nr:YhaN family protein [Desulfonatronospira thiodismutans]EFI34878.1 SMC domain protein [Desulfonatronospira thiodismutans ASO3-1]